MTEDLDPWLRPAWDRAALLIIDTQVDFLDGGASPIAGTRQVLPAITRLATAFRAAHRPIVHVVRLYDGADVDLPRRTLLDSGAPIVRPGTPGSQLAPQLRAPAAPPLDPDELLGGGFQQLGPAEWAMWKPRWGAFYRTGLDPFLRDLPVSTLVLAGRNFPNCPRATLVEASERDYQVVIAADAISGLQPWHLPEAENIGVLPATTATITANVQSGEQADVSSARPVR
jgi:nicotinamidase-related amidase